MKVEYHGGDYEVAESLGPWVSRWLKARELPVGVYRRIDESSKPIPGSSNEIYPDSTVHAGYHIVPADTQVKIGEEIQVGTGYLNNGSIGIVTGVSKTYLIAVESGVTDEDHSYSGFRATGYSLIKVMHVFFDLVPN